MIVGSHDDISPCVVVVRAHQPSKAVDGLAYFIMVRIRHQQLFELLFVAASS
jgi:hypothetical protein